MEYIGHLIPGFRRECKKYTLRTADSRQRSMESVGHMPRQNWCEKQRAFC